MAPNLSRNPEDLQSAATSEVDNPRLTKEAVNGNGNHASFPDDAITGDAGMETNETAGVKGMTVAELLAIPQEYRANGLKIVTMRIVKNEEDFLSQTPSSKNFKPAFVYQFFKEPGDKEAEEETQRVAESMTFVENAESDGDSEAEEDEEEQGEDGRIFLPDENEGLIVGYKDLKISLCFTAATLKPFVSVSFDEALPLAKRSVPDIVQAIEAVYGHKVMTSSNAMLTAIKEDTKFIPLGRKIHEFSSHLPSTNTKHTSELYEVGYDSQSIGYPARFSEYLSLIQPVLQWFIYAASIITADNSNWLHYFLYEKTVEGTYHLMGYCSVYRYPVWPKAEKATVTRMVDRKERCRIAQFLVLPPYQKSGHGARMLKSVISRLQENSNTYEITVEDPTSEFQHLFDAVTTGLVRDHLTSHPKLAVDYKKPLPADTIKELHKKIKFSPEALKFAFEVLACCAARREGQDAVHAYYANLTALAQKKVEEEINNLDRSWRRVQCGYYEFSEDFSESDKLRKLAVAGWQVNYTGQKDKQEKLLEADRIGEAVVKMSERTTHAAKRIDELS